MKLFCRAFMVVVGALTSVVMAQPLPSPTSIPKPSAVQVPVPPPPDVDAASYVLMDYATGQILAARRPDQRRAPASLTKLMTEYVVASEIANGHIHLDDMVTISKHAWKAGGAGTDGSTSFLAVGSKVKLIDLLRGMIVQSGNDAAIALAEHVAGTESAFVSLMNAYATQLGMSGSHFSDASGYPVSNHYVTAHDIAILARALIHNFPEDYALSKIKEFKWNGIKQHNRNDLLWRDATVDGIKTGYTSAAGYCLAASAKRGDERMIAIVMGATSHHARSNSALALLNYGFRFYKTYRLYAANQKLAAPRIWKAELDVLPIGVTEDVVVTVKSGQYGKLKASMKIPSTLVAPFHKGQQVGTLNITLDGKLIQSTPLVALQDAPRGSFFKRLWDAILLWFHHDDKKSD